MKRKYLHFILLMLIISGGLALQSHAGPGEAEWKVWKGKLNINKASQADFAMLDGIGKITAHRIVAYRDRMGGFKSISQLKEVRGMSEKKIKNHEENLTLFDESDLKVLIDINRAPVNVLEALPGISKKEAIAIAEYRERNEGFEKIEDLLLVNGISIKSYDELLNYVTLIPLETDSAKLP